MATSGFDSRKSKIFLYSVQTDSGVYRASYSVGTEGSFPGVMRPQREVDHQHPYIADWGCRVVCATDPHGRILGFLDRSR
jgi:hypothetical protein